MYLSRDSRCRRRSSSLLLSIPCSPRPFACCPCRPKHVFAADRLLRSKRQQCQTSWVYLGLGVGARKRTGISAACSGAEFGRDDIARAAVVVVPARRPIRRSIEFGYIPLPTIDTTVVLACVRRVASSSASSARALLRPPFRVTRSRVGVQDKTPGQLWPTLYVCTKPRTTLLYANSRTTQSQCCRCSQ
ncbi:modular polyketide synthase (ISS) [Anopheles sinensis]|uniref:Modular polyketide synthase (ISS) n=1 Tax=Anopheles sinensis TaxID=74873 RepID=A0A084VVN1_ANOSI|nr:modular polyketide synthase (ISS) [Anopheles sinensis]